jgi:hypothetical protein
LLLEQALATATKLGMAKISADAQLLMRAPTSPGVL